MSARRRGGWGVALLAALLAAPVAAGAFPGAERSGGSEPSGRGGQAAANERGTAPRQGEAAPEPRASRQRATGASTDANQPEPAEAEPPLVNLAERVPERWLTNAGDDLPLTPERWRRRVPERCRTRGGYRRHCQGELIAPRASGAGAALARRLSLGLRATAFAMMYRRPFPEWLDAVADMDPDESLLFPVEDGRTGRGFGRTRTGELAHRRHDGVDIGGDPGAPIRASRGGLVMYAGNELTGYGNVVILLHRGGDSTFYAHCRSLGVFAGQRVGRGHPIAEIGDTGFARAPHLHFEYRQRGWVRDPAPHFDRDRDED